MEDEDNKNIRFSPLKNGLVGLELEERNPPEPKTKNSDARSPPSPSSFLSTSPQQEEEEEVEAKKPYYSPLQEGLDRRRQSRNHSHSHSHSHSPSSCSPLSRGNSVPGDASTASPSSTLTFTPTTAASEHHHEHEHEQEIVAAATEEEEGQQQQEQQQVEEDLLVCCLESQDALLLQRERVEHLLEHARHGLLWYFNSSAHLVGGGGGVGLGGPQGRMALCHRAIRNLGLHPLHTFSSEEEEREREREREITPPNTAMRVEIQYNNKEEEEEVPCGDGGERGGAVKMHLKKKEKSRAREDDLAILRCFAAMPPPALREAQSRFKDVVEAVVELATRQIEAQRLKEKFVKQME